MFLFLLNSCSFESLIALDNVDKVKVSKQSTYYTAYRAYFTRTWLQPIKNKQKYLYYYNKKKKDLAILLHSYNHYTLYSLYHPNKSYVILKSRKHMRYKYIKKLLKKRGYFLTSPYSVGATSRIGLRKYKGIKTLFVEIKDYSLLQKKYKQAIRTYNSRSIIHIKTRLPNILIKRYFKLYQKKASAKNKIKQLEIIARKLHLNTPKVSTSININKMTQKTKIEDNEEEKIKREEKKVQRVLSKEVPEKPEPLDEVPPSRASFEYYRNDASYLELKSYLDDAEAINSLDSNQYTQLTHRYEMLKDRKILKNGSLETLISRYKINKDPDYKKRILELMKKAQQ